MFPRRARVWLIGVSAFLLLAAGGYAATASVARLPRISAVLPICTELTRAADPAERSFLQENASVMAAMMEGMAIAPSGDIDRDFVAMMVAHHWGASEMARAELRSGHNVRLTRMAQEIIVTQMQEIAAMRLAMRDAATSIALPDQSPPAGVGAAALEEP